MADAEVVIGAGIVGAGLFALTGALFVALGVLTSTPAEQPTARLRCGSGPGQLGLACGGSFQ